MSHSVWLIFDILLWTNTMGHWHWYEWMNHWRYLFRSGTLLNYVKCVRENVSLSCKGCVSDPHCQMLLQGWNSIATCDYTYNNKVCKRCNWKCNFLKHWDDPCWDAWPLSVDIISIKTEPLINVFTWLCLSLAWSNFILFYPNFILFCPNFILFYPNYILFKLYLTS